MKNGATPVLTSQHSEAPASVSCGTVQPKSAYRTIDSIFLVGSFSDNSAESSFRRGFDAIGIRTATLDVRAPECRLGLLLRNRAGHRLSINSLTARRAASRKFNRSIEEAVLRSGVPAVFIMKGDFVMPETLERLRRHGVRVALFHPDNPFPPHYANRPETLASARETDLYLIWSERLAGKLKDAGVPNPAFLPFAWDPVVFPHQGDRPQGTWPGVLFLGNWDKEREEFLEELAAHVELCIYGADLWASRTRSSSRLRRCWRGSILWRDDAARAVRDAAVCINILRTQHTIDGAADGLIMRHFEVPGAGGFLLSTRGSGATGLFPEGDTAEYFSDLSECVEKAKRYIADSEARHRIVERSHAAVAAHHRYADRACRIVQLLENCD